MPEVNGFSAGLWTQMLEMFRVVIHGSMGGTLGPWAVFMLRLLGSLEIVGLAVTWAVSDESNAIVANVLAIGIRVGVFVLLITRMAEWSMQFAEGSAWVGLQVGGAATGMILGATPMTLAQFRDPGAIMLAGWQVTLPLWEHIRRQGWLALAAELMSLESDWLIFGISVLIAWLAFLLLGLQVFVAWIELWVVSGIAIGFLPWGIWRYTSFIGESMLVAVISAGIRLGVLATMVSLIVPVMGAIQIVNPQDPGYDSAMAVAGLAVTFVYLAWEIPRFMAGLLVGSQGFTGSGLLAMGLAGARMTVSLAAAGVGAAARQSAMVAARTGAGGRP
jgi:type IV secretion system protein TrbL